MQEILNYFGCGGLLAILIAVCFEIAPIKINPIQWLGNRFNMGIKNDLENVRTEVKNIKHQMEEDNASDARYRILRFDDEIRHEPSKKHTEEHFNQIMDDIQHYNLYCETHPTFRNHKARSAIKKINEVYEKCRSENSFLV